MPSYMNRAMQSRDPRFVRVLEKLGHKRPVEKPAAKAKASKATKPAVPLEAPKYDDDKNLPGFVHGGSFKVGSAAAEFLDAQPTKPTPEAED